MPPRTLYRAADVSASYGAPKWRGKLAVVEDGRVVQARAVPWLCQSAACALRCAREVADLTPEEYRAACR